VGDLKSRLAEIEKLTGGDKKKPIVVHCQSGGRSQRAKELLTAEGYEQVTNLGGIDDWDRK
jgi:adenylyltransferase/sulfurtransferase